MLLDNPGDLTAVMEPAGESSGHPAGASPSTSPTCALVQSSLTYLPFCHESSAVLGAVGKSWAAEPGE